MNTTLILNFLKNIAAHNTREWFQAHRDEYLAARSDFEKGIDEAIRQIATIDPSVAHLTVKDCTYRFNRDTRFSNDKSPYKTHFGAYIAAHGRKAMHGGYYLHLEPGHCLLSLGNYWLPTKILTACRNEIMGNEEEWQRIVENADFKRLFGAPETAGWDSPQGFGLERLKTCPAGFPRDYPHLAWLRMKDYCCWHQVGDDFFGAADWLRQMTDIFRAGKPMMDFINNVIDDYE